MSESFVTTDDLRRAFLDIAARRRYRIMYGPQEWEDGSERGHDEARAEVTAEDVAVVASILWSKNGTLRSTDNEAADFGSYVPLQRDEET